MNPPIPSLTPARLCVAPMMRWTDRHCRYLHRLYAPDALLFTEMVTTGALLHGKQWQLLDHSPAEQPLALQLGGNDPNALAECAEQAAKRGFVEINLNVGCPSERVQNGTFGACLMRDPELVANCVAAMQKASSVPVTVKCRLGIDDLDNDEYLHRFICHIREAGCRRVYLHARKAILGGLTPEQNRTIPPLQPERAKRVKHNHPQLEVIMNGGITDLATALDYLNWADGIMVGRAAYQHPDFLRELQLALFKGDDLPNKFALLRHYQDYVIEQLSRGVKLHALTRHMLSSCNGQPGARRFRQLLSDQQRLKDNDPQLLAEALSQVFAEAA